MYGVRDLFRLFLILSFSVVTVACKSFDLTLNKQLQNSQHGLFDLSGNVQEQDSASSDIGFRLALSVA